MDRAKIEAQVPHFFDWPAGSPKDTVTLTSCILFAQTIAQMATEAERERCALAVAAETIEEPNDDPIAAAYNDAVFNCITACRTANAVLAGRGQQ